MSSRTHLSLEVFVAARDRRLGLIAAIAGALPCVSVKLGLTAAAR